MFECNKGIFNYIAGIGLERYISFLKMLVGRAFRNLSAPWCILKRGVSVGSQVIDGLHEPSAPRPGFEPKWTSDASEMFAELKDGTVVFLSR